MKKITVSLIYLLFTGLIMALSIAGPEMFSKYRDKYLLEEIHFIAAQAEGEGYRYTLSPGEKLYILSESLTSQSLPESDQYALTRNSRTEPEYGDFTGTYSFIVNRMGPSGTEITKEQIYEVCSQGLEDLKDLEILPDTVKTVEEAHYDAVLYSAIDVLEPRNNVVVWKLSLSNSQKNRDKENRMIDAYIDADNGKIYEFYVRTPLLWKDIDPDLIAEQWSSYIGLPAPVPYEDENPLLETTPYFKKYVFSGIGEEKTIVTIGFYEGINELFLKISK